MYKITIVSFKPDVVGPLLFVIIDVNVWFDAFKYCIHVTIILTWTI